MTIKHIHNFFLSFYGLMFRFYVKNHSVPLNICKQSFFIKSGLSKVIYHKTTFTC